MMSCWLILKRLGALGAAVSGVGPATGAVSTNRARAWALSRIDHGVACIPASASTLHRSLRGRLVIDLVLMMPSLLPTRYVLDVRLYPKNTPYRPCAPMLPSGSCPDTFDWTR